jgi:hypothetical protein
VSDNTYPTNQTPQSIQQPPKPPSTGLATAGLVLGIIALVFAFIPVVGLPVGVGGGALALLFGLIGMVKKQGGKAIAGLILGLLAIIISVAMANLAYKAADAVLDELDEVVASANADLGDLTGDNTDALLQTDVNVEMGTFTRDDYFTKLPVTVTNISDETQSYFITIAAIGADGNQLDTSTISVTDLSAGQSTVEDAFTLVMSDEEAAYQAATFDVTSVSLL